MSQVCRKICCKYKYFFLAFVMVLGLQLFLGLNFSFYTVPYTQRNDPSGDQKEAHVSLDGDLDSDKGATFKEKIHNHPSVSSSSNVVEGPSLKCKIDSKDALSAIQRAKTSVCKQEIADLYCKSLQGELYPHKLYSTCHLKGENSKGYYYGCYYDSKKERDLSLGQPFKETNSPEKCINFCLMSGFQYAGLQYSSECWCGNRFGVYGSAHESLCSSKCPGEPSASCGGFLVNKVYSTGLAKIKKDEPPLATGSVVERSVKIVFVLTVTGRAIRQIRRLLKTLYHINHYYYIHVDQRQKYLYRELLPLERQFSNIYLAKNRFSTIWGGASLLKAHFSFMKELLEKKDWTWDYYINLSESDYPVKKLESLEIFLTANKGKLFLKSHGSNTPKFISKQGLEKTFYECENHLWRVGSRTLPTDIRFDGGSDWVCLPREFVTYTLHTEEEHIAGIKELYKYSLLPVERN